MSNIILPIVKRFLVTVNVEQADQQTLRALAAAAQIDDKEMAINQLYDIMNHGAKALDKARKQRDNARRRVRNANDETRATAQAAYDKHAAEVAALSVLFAARPLSDLADRLKYAMQYTAMSEPTYGADAIAVESYFSEGRAVTYAEAQNYVDLFGAAGSLRGAVAAVAIIRGGDNPTDPTDPTQPTNEPATREALAIEAAKADGAAVAKALAGMERAPGVAWAWATVSDLADAIARGDRLAYKYAAAACGSQREARAALQAARVGLRTDDARSIAAFLKLTRRALKAAAVLDGKDPAAPIEVTSAVNLILRDDLPTSVDQHQEAAEVGGLRITFDKWESLAVFLFRAGYGHKEAERLAAGAALEWYAAVNHAGQVYAVQGITSGRQRVGKRRAEAMREALTDAMAQARAADDRAGKFEAARVAAMAADGVPVVPRGAADSVKQKPAAVLYYRSLDTVAEVTGEQYKPGGVAGVAWLVSFDNGRAVAAAPVSHLKRYAATPDAAAAIVDDINTFIL